MSVRLTEATYAFRAPASLCYNVGNLRNRRLSMMSSPQERFWARVNKGLPKECWEWKSASVRGGYGQISVNGKRAIASRMSWELHNGKIPNGMFVCHHCDNPPCVNPGHLFLGTNFDNALDRTQKGRQPPNQHVSQTRCLRGHSLADAYREASHGKIQRVCRVCKAKRNQRYEKTRIRIRDQRKVKL